MSYCGQNSNHKGKVTRAQALKALALKFTENNLVVTRGRRRGWGGEGQYGVGGGRCNLLGVRQPTRMLCTTQGI